MAASASIVTDLTTCPICMDLFDNPKSLPCLHAFCLKCLQGYFKNSPGDEVPCPMCRKGFQIPSGGLGGLQHHFFAQRLVDFQKASNEEFGEAPCEVCVQASDGGSDNVPTATMYCVDCNQKLCEQCSRPHRWMKGGAHQVKPLGADVEQELIQLRGSSCDKHTDEQVKLYCHDCNENICLMCSAVKHRNHNCGEIPEVAESFRQRIDDDAEQILSAIGPVREQSGLTKHNATDFLSKVEDVKKTVLATGDVVKRSVDNQINDVLTELEYVTSESTNQAQSVQEAFQLAVVSMESFHTYSRELLDKGRPCDITRAARELHERAQELMNNDVTAVQYHPPHVTFIPADVTQVKRFNLIGKLAVTTSEQPEEQHVETKQEKQASDTAAVLQDELIQAAVRERQLQMQLDKMKAWLEQRPNLQKELERQHEIKQRDMGRAIRKLPQGETVEGVTSLDSHLYVLRGKRSDQVEVYDINSYHLQRCLTVPELGTASDIVACAHNRCAYISDSRHESIHKVALSDDTTTQWPVNDEPHGLSLSLTHGVLVTYSDVRKIKEFSTDGQLLRKVKLPDDVVSPWHSVQLSSGEFVVCHGDRDDPVHRVCLVSSGGQVVKSFGGSKGSSSQQINLPTRLAVDEHGFVFVVDACNRRVLLLSPSLTFVRQVVSREQLTGRPRAVHLDLSRQHLYVADDYAVGDDDNNVDSNEDADDDNDADSNEDSGQVVSREQLTGRPQTAVRDDDNNVDSNEDADDDNDADSNEDAGQVVSREQFTGRPQTDDDDSDFSDEDGGQVVVFSV